MGRRRRSLLDEALESNWPVAAVLAVGCFVLGFIVVPSIVGSSPLTAPIAHVGKVGLGFLGLVFSAIAVFKLLGEWVASRFQPETLDLDNADVTMLRPKNASWRPTGTANFNTTVQPEPVFQVKPTSWSVELLQTIEWKRFEDLCAAYYREKGIRSETTPMGADGGVDIRLYQDPDSSKATAVVQCKAWGERWVGVKPIRELLGVMTHERIEKAFFMAPGGFTDEARKFAEANRITLLDGKLFLAMLNRLPEPSRDKLLSFATQGDYTTPTCPKCAIPLVKRHGSKGAFWGCKNYPRCRQTLQMRKGAD